MRLTKKTMDFIVQYFSPKSKQLHKNIPIQIFYSGGCAEM